MAESADNALLPGWFRDDPPCLLGSRCVDCGTVYFPRQGLYCRNPACDSTEFVEHALSRTGTLWSFTDACYQPPSPYVAAEPYQPFAIAAVELAAERMIVLGQVVTGVGVDALAVGQTMEVVIEALDDGCTVWKWQPVTGS